MTTAKRAASDAGQTETSSASGDSRVVPSRTGEGDVGIAANAMKVVVSCADDYLAAVAGLGEIVEGKTLFEHSPTKNEAAYLAWTRLNDTGKRLKECCDRLRPALAQAQPAPTARVTGTR